MAKVAENAVVDTAVSGVNVGERSDLSDVRFEDHGKVVKLVFIEHAGETNSRSKVSVNSEITPVLVGQLTDYVT